MKKARSKRITASILAAVLAVLFVMPVYAEQENNDTPRQFVDCFLPMPVIGNLSSDAWGADLVGARDQQNGLEDPTLENYEYWDGGIFKNEQNGKYYMFGSRWDQAGGHWGNDEAPGWQGSVAIYATSDNLYGPYEDQGMLWADWCEGAGHNVFPFKISESDTLYAQGYRYAISISDTGLHSETANGTLHISKSLDGPWELIDNGNGGKLNVTGGSFSLSNISICVREDGMYETVNRDGDIATADSLTGVWQLQKKSIWESVGALPQGNLEDPVIWYADGKYHIIVNKWDAMTAYYLVSEDGINGWKRTKGIAYSPSKDFLRYEDGTYNRWHKLERPNIYMENGVIRAMTFGVVDDVKENDLGNDQHGSKVIVVPFDGEALQRLDSETDTDERTGAICKEDAHTQSWDSEADANYGTESIMSIQKDPDYESSNMGSFGQGSRPSQWYDSKIAYLKYNIDELVGNSNTVENAELSLIYTGRTAGNASNITLQAAVADSNWSESELNWNNQPDIDTALIAESDTFSASKNDFEVNIDVTDIVNQFLNGAHGDSITFAISIEQTGTRIGIASREMGDEWAPRLTVKTANETETSIENFENKMNGKVYTGMHTAYLEYLKAVNGEKNYLLYASANMKEWNSYSFGTASTAADGTYKRSSLQNNDEMKNVLYTYGVGNSAPFDQGTNIKYTSGLISYNSEIYANYGAIVFINNGGEMTCPVNTVFHNGGANSNRLRYIKINNNSDFYLNKNWSGYVTDYINHTYQTIFNRTLGYDDWSEMETPGKNTYTTFTNTLHCTLKPNGFVSAPQYITFLAENNKDNKGNVTGSAPVYVVNYEYYINAVPQMNYDVSNYRHGGLENVLKAYDDAIKYNPYTEFNCTTDLDVNSAVANVEATMQSNINAINNASVISDEEQPESAHIYFGYSAQAPATCTVCGHSVGYIADNSALIAAINKTKALPEYDYTPESYSALINAVNEYDKWTVSPAPQDEIDSAVTEILTKISELRPYLKLTVEGDGGAVNVSYGSISGNYGTYKTVFGDRITLTATPDKSHNFAYWFDTVSQRVMSKNANYSFVITSNTAIKAVFVGWNSATLTFMNSSGFVCEKITKTPAEWLETESLEDLLPALPYEYGGTNGRWDYDNAEVLQKLRSGENATITAVFDNSATLPEIPVPADGTPALTLTYQFDEENSVGTFIMAAGIPENCEIESVGIAFYNKKAANFDPREFDLNINNKTLTSKFEPSDESNRYIVDLMHMTDKYNWAVKGYVTYYDGGELRIAYTNQINIINRNAV
ncbi:MAG: glycoside hydrolase family protein [Eubacterium sp.]|nr:glycoside hydrolase family protein [Eubacterium sp.]